MEKRTITIFEIKIFLFFRISDRLEVKFVFFSKI